MPTDSMLPLTRTFAVVVLATLLADCGSDRGTGAVPAVATPQVAMAGRWVLSAASGGSCGMRFGGDPGAREGTIAPEGGCPGRFFTSRKWTFEQQLLVIQDHRGQALAQLNSSAPDRFEGKSSIGPAVTLARPSE